MIQKSLAAAVLASSMLAAAAHAQATRDASRPFGISVFGGATGTYTGFGRNAAFTAGLDLNVHPDSRLSYSVELRGTEPVNGGNIAEEKNFLAGPKVNYSYRRFHPYADVLAGRGQIDYFGAGLQVPGVLFFYTKSHSTVYAGGGGLDYQLSESFSLKLDGQAQRYSTPVTTSGHVIAKSGTVGLTYTFPFHRRKGISEF